MIVLGVDLETDSVDIDRAAVIEIAAVLYDTVARQPLLVASSLINVERRLRPLPRPIVDVTGITEKMLGRYGLLDEAYVRLLCGIRDKIACHTDVVVTHNGTVFDLPILEFEFERYKIPDYLHKTKRIDTMTDINYPLSNVYMNLTNLAANHRVQHAFCHRALSDVFAMLQILEQYDVDEILKAALTPIISLRATPSKKHKPHVKHYGFSYNYEEKCYIRDIRSYYEEEVIKSIPFDVTIIDTE